jgi:PKD repeat protein
MGVGHWGRIRGNCSAPYHSYAKAGLYTVTLTVRNANGSSQIVKQNCIKIRK